MNAILQRFLNGFSSDPLESIEAKDYIYEVKNPEEWNRVPRSIEHHSQLSAPKVDILIGGNTSTISYQGPGLHPLSLECMQNLIRDPKMKEKVPLKSTTTRNASTMHDLFVIEVKDTGCWKEAQNSDALERDAVMDVARNQVINANFVQLASMAELKAHAPLDTDNVFYDPGLFVLGMTICGAEWTVEYATRYPTKKATVSQPQPLLDLYQCADSLRFLIRLGSLRSLKATGVATPATSCSWFRW